MGRPQTKKPIPPSKSEERTNLVQFLRADSGNRGGQILTRFVWATLHDPLRDCRANPWKVRRQRIGRCGIHGDLFQVLFGEGGGGEEGNDKQKIRDFQGVFFLFFVVRPCWPLEVPTVDFRRWVVVG